MECNSRTHIIKWYSINCSLQQIEGKKTHKHISRVYVVFWKIQRVDCGWKCFRTLQRRFYCYSNFKKSAWCPNVAQTWLATAWRGWRPSYNTTANKGKLKSVLFFMVFSSSGRSLPLQSHSTQVSVEDLPSKTSDSAFDSLSAAGHAWKAQQLCRAEATSRNFSLSAGTLY